MTRIFLSLLFCALVGDLVVATPFQNQMPKENVVEVPAVSDGFCVTNVFQSNMVLQRDKPIHIWGWGTPGDSVQISFASESSSAKCKQDRRWDITLPAQQANSEPQTMRIKSGDIELVLDNLLVGDVWVLGGQSNMEFPLDRIENGKLEIVSANYKNIRVLTVPAQNGPNNKDGFERLHEWSSWFGRHYRKGDWDECSPEIARELSAIGYVFARRIHMATEVPIGVIDASRGGTTVETWTPDSVLRSLDSERVSTLLADWDQRVKDWDPQADLKNRIKRFHDRIARFEKEGRKLPANEKEPDDLKPGPIMDQNKPGNCYASMLHPLKGLSVKGAIFHQGYNNCFNGSGGAKMYREIFPEMIKAWRETFRDPEMPFGILSLCTEGAVQTLDNYSEMMANAGPYIREAQYETFLELYRAGDKNIGFTSTFDLRRRWYHPQLKIPAGERIARWALATQYGFDREIKWKPPMVESVSAKSGSLEVRFDSAVDSVDDGSPIVGFAVAGEDRKFHPATAEHLVTGQDDRGRPKKDNRVLVLSSPLVSEPVHYRYAWARSPLGNLQLSRMTDIPLATQRSDDWSMESIPLGVLGETEVTTKLDRQQNRKVREALQQLDRERRLFHAKQLMSDDNN